MVHGGHNGRVGEKTAPNLKAVEQYDAIREEEKKQVGGGAAGVLTGGFGDWVQVCGLWGTWCC